MDALSSDPWLCLVSDNDGHWYIIKETEKDRFNEWVNNAENCEDDDEGWKRFDGECRVNGPYFVAFPTWRESNV